MKVLAVGLDSTAVALLHKYDIAAENQCIKTAEDLHAWFALGRYDAGVIDFDHVDLDMRIARELREKKNATLLIGITSGTLAYDWREYRALFLENGGDDLLHGPVNTRELAASLRAVARRSKGTPSDIVEYDHGGAHLVINLNTKSVTVNGVKCVLTRKELNVMLLLASSPGRPVSKETFLTRLYAAGADDEPKLPIYTVYICTLRKKLRQIHSDAAKFIETVNGFGYRLPERNET